ncbi:hypothetical protein HMPREF0765_3254 [Sphingobacterium spiritivorum ATCC 33300]|uniref:Uncharacterized protein n=1 Tax=Sphingobacterium spiritivorum ATCC 33300 TaxID=525372 RepID=C2G0Z8_SPHSI|nr:hypothetical protein HMPREF0765_3254 [Sphingobacterium spiritivorum ATCC 33300]
MFNRKVYDRYKKITCISNPENMLKFSGRPSSVTNHIPSIKI